MDGLPGMKRALAVGQQENVDQKQKMVGPLAPRKAYRRTRVPALGALTIVFTSFMFGVLFSIFIGLTQDFPGRLGEFVSTANLHSSTGWV